MKVYILSTFEEHGSREVRATTDPNQLPDMLSEYWDDNEHELNALREVGEDGWEINRDGYSLSRAWGGALLHIVELE